MIFFVNLTIILFGKHKHIYTHTLIHIKNKVMNQIKDLLEKSAFGVCSYLGRKMGIASSRVRLYFIYTSFVALGSPVIFYLFVAFWINIKKYIQKGKSILWE